MSKNRYRIQFPPADSEELPQDEISFTLIEDGKPKRLRFHDYDEIYKRPGLYEQLFYERLRCNSPKKVADLLQRALNTVREPITELRVLDLGAGNGMMGEVLKREGVARLVGADIIQEARDAAYRDRSAVYDDYYIADFTDLDSEVLEELRDWDFDCLTCVAALGFGDIPPKAFFQAMKLIRPDGWLAFNIKESFLDYTEQTGFSRLVRELIFSQYPRYLSSRTLPPPTVHGGNTTVLLRPGRPDDIFNPGRLSGAARNRGLGQGSSIEPCSLRTTNDSPE